MEQIPTPIIPETPQSSVGEGSAKIAVAIITIPEKASVTFCWTCEKALAASLRRGSIFVMESMPIYHENFVVSVFTVSRSQRADALESIKQTLAELDLLSYASIAVDRAGEGWIGVHGIVDGGIKFADGFLRPEYFQASLAAFRNWSDDRRAIWQAMAEEAKRKAAAEGQNPESE